MANGVIGIVVPDTPTDYLDAESLSVGGNPVSRERVQISGVGATHIAPVDPTNGLAVDIKTLPPGAATQATLALILTEIGGLLEATPGTDIASSGLNGRLQRIAQLLTQLNTTLGTPMQAGGTIGNTAFAATQSGTWNTGTTVFSTATPTQVASSATAVTILAANAGRRGASVYYDGAAILYLLEGSGTPSATNWTIKMGSGYFTEYEVQPGFTGILKGIWSSAVGSANVTERS